jgi:pimeloyl-ACP methyl ester carboxylesterase
MRGLTMGNTFESGTLGGRFGYLRFGEGPRKLVILPGLYLDGEAPGGLAARAYAYGFRALTAAHTVYVIRRPRGLSVGTSIADLAAQYGRLLRSEFGRADVVGLSTGGLIAQELALGDPDAVDRLALVVSGARIAEPGRWLCA